jgi:hypothetical protein
LGVRVEDGCVEFEPGMLRHEEFHAEACTWTYSTGESRQREEELSAGSLAFSICGVPVIYRLAETYGIRVQIADGSEHEIAGNRLGNSWSQSLFRRDGSVQKIIVDIPTEELR